MRSGWSFNVILFNHSSKTHPTPPDTFFLLLRIKNIIHKNDGKEEVCDERDGWCVPHTADELRNIISGMIQQYVRASRPGTKQKKRCIVNY